MTWTALAGVAAIHLIAAISPGPSFVVILRVAAAEGLRAALLVALGFGLGAMAWAAAALLGLAVLFQVAPALLTVLKLGGAAFLLFIAVLTWRHADTPLPEATAGAAPRRALSALRLGLLTQLANPKVPIFFGAVFVGLLPERIGWTDAMLVLTLVLIVETAWYGIVARVFSLPGTRRVYARIKRWVDRAFGGLLAAFSLKIATS